MSSGSAPHDVRDENRAVPVHVRADVLDRIAHARRRFRVHDRHDVVGALAQELADGVGIDRAPPTDVQPVQDGAVPRQHVRQPVAEVAGDNAERTFAGLDEIGDHRFHRRRARAGDGEHGRLVRRLEQLVQARANVVEQRHELGIEVRARRRRERLEHALRDRRRAGTEQQLFGGGDHACP
jgi:hypothetical protein